MGKILGIRIVLDSHGADHFFVDNQRNPDPDFGDGADQAGFPGTLNEHVFL
jgi:hypothetical protein